jgi:hypothetical protein
MSSEAFTAFLTESLAVCESNAVDGSIHFVCMDWRHVGELMAAGASVFAELKNLCVWVKSNAGQGSFYRSQHELIFVFKKGEGAHVNNFGLGQSGRSRSNVWHYAGINSFRAGRLDELKMHPTVKPVALVSAIARAAVRSCSTPSWDRARRSWQPNVSGAGPSASRSIQSMSTLPSAAG